jgi:hypothetical protein
MRNVFYGGVLALILLVVSFPDAVGRWDAKREIAFNLVISEYYCYEQEEPWECENHE